jgi:hypothetical protein
MSQRKVFTPAQGADSRIPLHVCSRRPALGALRYSQSHPPGARYGKRGVRPQSLHHLEYGTLSGSLVCRGEVPCKLQWNCRRVYNPSFDGKPVLEHVDSLCRPPCLSLQDSKVRETRKYARRGRECGENKRILTAQWYPKYRER